MDLQQKLSEPSSTVFPIPKAGFTPISKYLSPRLGTFFTGLNRRARRAISRLLLLTFRDRNKPTWTNEVRGRVGDEDFILLVCARYVNWTTTINGTEFPLQLNAVMNDPKRVLDALGYVHGDKSRRLYFVADFDLTYTDRKGVTEPLPRATLPRTEQIALPNEEGILAVFKEASKNGGSGFAHFGVHCMHELAGTSSILEENGVIHLTNTPHEGADSNETFIVGIDAHRIYGRDLLLCLPDLSGRTGTTVTLSFDMCNAAGYLAGEVDLPYLYLGADEGEHAEPVRTNYQLVVISACQLGQVAGEFGRCGAMTYFLTDNLINVPEATAADIVQDMRARFQEHPIPSRRQLPQMASRYPLTGRFRLLPHRPNLHDLHAML